MSLDVVDLRSFYESPLGHAAQRYVWRIIRSRWESCTGLSVMGIGYATPHLRLLREEAMRTLAFMPAEQGVVNWPSSGASASALVEATMMPLPDACIDRVLVIHALEVSEHPRDLLEEVWRILTPGGRMIVVAPNRAGLWARVDATPFGHGQPYSRGQLRDLLRATLFSPVHWGEALWFPPFARKLWLKAAPAFERAGAGLSAPGAGVLVVEATKQLYRPIPLRRASRRALQPVSEPVLVPAPRISAQ